MPLTQTAAELSAWLRLSWSRTSARPPPARCSARWACPSRSTRSEATALARHLPEALARQLAAPMPADMQAQVERSLEWAEAPDHHILTLADPGYPQSLLTISDPPILLMVTGNRPSCKARRWPWWARAAPRPAARKTRAPSPAIWHRMAGAWSADWPWASTPPRTARWTQGAQGGGTVAVMGTGIDRIYPARHRELAHRIAAHGALVSSCRWARVRCRSTFPKRNRIVAGLARGVLVVEAARQSGSLITARLAGECGREVFAIPGSIHSPLSRGCHALIRQGAKLVETAQDITDELGGSPLPSRPASRASAAPPLPAHPVLEAWASIRCTWTPSRPAAAWTSRTCKRSWSNWNWRRASRSSTTDATSA